MTAHTPAPAPLDGAPCPDGPVLERIPTHTAQVGGIPVRRAIPTRHRRMVGAWCFLDLMGPAVLSPGQGLNVGPHPHIGLQTFTWMLRGEIQHRDSLGYAQVIRPGQVNLMTAGRGISHSEESLGDGPILASQLWIALPDAMRHCEPAFAHHPVLPQTMVGDLRATLLAGQALGLRAPTEVHTPLVGMDLLAPDAPVTADVPLAPDFEHAILCLEGRLQVEDAVVASGELLYLGKGRAHVRVQCEAQARLLLIGGQPFEEPVLMWWNFVGRTPEEIQQAAQDWNAGERFGTVAGTALARIPAPSPEGLRRPAPRLPQKEI